MLQRLLQADLVLTVS